LAFGHARYIEPEARPTASKSMPFWYANSLLEHAGSKAIGDYIHNEIFYPGARRLVPRCAACLPSDASRGLFSDALPALGKSPY